MRGDETTIPGGSLGDAGADDPEAAMLLAIVRRRLTGAQTPSAIGRFEVQRRLGAGGMGVVYAARDEDLRREVALKLVATPGPDETARLRREAQALAALSHPHVVQVYDVGTHEEQLWIAMELVEGPTLGEWLAEAPRSPDELLRVYAGAARGLAAAHARGIVHRDFKPANVLIGTDGRARVVDFGLAVGRLDPTTVSADTVPPARRHADLDPPTPSAWGEGVDLLGDTLTRTGTLLGTPAYMAPEQARGERVDAASDQYSFCVALFEALLGQRPFPREDRIAFLEAASADRIDWPSSVRGVPRRVRSVLRRGLAHDAERRFADMPALLRALTGSGRAGLRWAAAGVVLASLGAGGAWVWTAADVHRERPCTGAEAELSDAWSAARRAAVAGAFVATGLDSAPDTAHRVGAAIDEYAESWVAAHETACRQARDAGADGQAELERRMRCLDRRREALASLVDGLVAVGATPEPGSSPAAAVSGALASVQALDPVDGCDEPLPIVGPGLAVDPDKTSEAEEVWELVQRAHQQQVAGDLAGANAKIQAATVRAEELGDAGLLSLARQRKGNIEMLLGDYSAARATLEAAYFGAGDAEDRRPALLAALTMVELTGLREQRFAQADQWIRHAQSELSRSEGGESYRGKLLHMRGRIAGMQGEVAQAVELHERANALVEEVHPDEPNDLALSRLQLGMAYRQAGKLEEAEASLRSAIATWVAAFGADHPNVAAAQSSLGIVMYLRGDYEGAVQAQRDAAESFAATVGVEHPNHARALANLANALVMRAQWEEAEQAATEALRITTKTLDESHPMLVGMQLIVAGTQERGGRPTQAEATYRKALLLAERVSGPEDENVAIIRNNLAHTLVDQGRPEEALAEATRALEVWRVALGDDHPDIATGLSTRGRVLAVLGRADEAAAALEDAVRRRVDAVGETHLETLEIRVYQGEVDRQRGEVDTAIERLQAVVDALASDEGAAGLRGHARVALAEALADAGRRTDARRQAQAAREELETTGGWFGFKVARADAVLE